MKAKFNRDSLLSACQLAQQAAAKRNVKPILMHLKLSVEESGSYLEATDLEISLRVQVQGVACEHPGACTVEPGRLIAILREATDEQLVIEVEASHQIAIIGMFTEYHLTGNDAAEFPSAATLEEGAPCHEFQADVLKLALQRVHFAAATENQRYAVTGVLADLGAECRMVATDGRRLAVASVAGTVHGEHKVEFSHVLPSRAVGLLQSLLAGEELVSISLRPNDAIAQTAHATLFSRLVEGRYPDWNAIFPKKPKYDASFEASVMLKAIRQAAIMTNQESNRVTFAFRPNLLRLSSQSTEHGKAKVETAIEYAGKDLDVNMDPRFVSEFLKVLPADKRVLLHLTDGSTPVLFVVGAAGDADFYRYVVMPMS